MARSGGAPVSTAPAVSLSDLPYELRAHLVVSLENPRDLAAANATSRLFRGAPGGRSPVEHALRERARARGHARALPAELPTGVCSWTEELFARERVLKLARAHALPVACSQFIGTAARFSAFVDAEGGLHTCGEEQVWDEEFMEPTGEYRPHMALGHPGVAAVLLPTRVASLSSVRVRSVAAGGEHLLALSEAGAVYGCGYNDHGQLGLGDTVTRRTFQLIRRLGPQLVVCIAAASYHSLALTAAGSAYSWGNNYFGQLGHGDKEDRWWEPTRIEALDGVRVGGVAAGRAHTLLLFASGDVYCCGCRIDHADEQAQLTRGIEALAGVRAVQVSAGAAHGLVVDADGSVRSFGVGTVDGRDGGLGHAGSARILPPRRVEALAGVHAVRACAGYFSSAVLGADGSVHAFGDNRKGQLGLGQRPVDAGVLPARVGLSVHERVVGCSLGEAHSLYVTADGAVYVCGKQRSAALGLGVSAGDAEEADGQHGQHTAGIPTRVAQLPRIAA